MLFRSRTNDAIEWRDVRILPNATAEFPAEPGQSHYYAARETDAAPLQVGSQKEKFLFYRGVGTFALPISVKAEADGRILVKNLRADEVSGLILLRIAGESCDTRSPARCGTRSYWIGDRNRPA